MRERHIFFRGISSWVGFRKTTVSFEVLPRLEGESKWPIRSLCRYATSNIASFTTVPLQAVTILGVLFFFCSILLGAQTLWHKMVGDALEGFTTVILLLLIIGSILMICLGIIGYYLARIYEEIKDRPRYLVSEQCGDNLEKID